MARTSALCSALPRLLLSLILPGLGASAASARVDGIEVAFGASNIEAIAGNGRLTVGVSRDGDVSVLSWPSPSFYDQVHALQANGIGARHLPRMGLHDGMGVFSLVAVEQDDGSVDVIRLHDEEVQRQVAYASDDSSVVVTRFTLPERGIVIEQRDVVPPGADVLVRHYLVEREDAAAGGRLWLMAYQNLSPNLSKIPKVPMAGVLLDHKNDFLAAWDEERGSLVHFHPEDTGVVTSILGALRDVERDFGPLGALLASDVLDGDVLDALLTDLDGSYAAGVYAAIGSVPSPDAYQVGEDATDTCAAIDAWIDHAQELPTILPNQELPSDPSLFDEARCRSFDPVEDVRAAEGWLLRPRDALEDALDDGGLEGSRLAGGQVNTALRVPLEMTASADGERGEVTVFLAFGRTHADATALLAAAQEEGAAALEQAAVTDSEAFVRSVRLPEGGSDGLQAFSKRTLLNLRVGTDAATGAIVASVSRQPPYQLDWPRDGAFFNAALDLSGQHDLVTKRLLFYASVMRLENSPPVAVVDTPVPGWPDCDECEDYPAGSWEMNYFADGVVGGNIRLEVDNTALLVWSFAAHAGYLGDEEREAFLEEVWPTVRRAADFLAYWRDDRSGLVWFANEDDHVRFTQGLQGAVTVFGALKNAARVAKALGHDDKSTAWAGRASELRAALLEHLHDDELGFLVDPRAEGEEPRVSRGGASSWVAWPARVLPWDDARVVRALEDGMATQMPKVRGEGVGGSYTTKVAVAAALALPDGAGQAGEMAEILATEIASPTTRQLGEVFVNVDEDGDGVTDGRENAVAPPHLWAASLVYLTAMAVHAPELFDPHEDVLPVVVIPKDEVPSSCGCSKASSSSSESVSSLLLSLFALVIADDRRRRRRVRS